MIIDLVLITIMVICLVLGFRKGFLYTIVHSLGWLISLAGAFFLTDPVSGFLKEHTEIYNRIYRLMLGNFSGPADSASTYYDSLPDVIGEKAAETTNDITESLAATFADAIFAILVFVLIFLVIKIILWLILRGFSKRHRDGLSGCFDGILGLAAGAIKGAILVLLFLALLMPFINFVSPDSADAVMQSLQQSYIAGFLYDHNVILLSGQLNISNLF
ncbi:MAG: CvpA family protein [Firmicutes bacterium]|nr:CvpA family protein [Bacillota bacterium]